MKGNTILRLVLGAALALSAVACSKVDPGHVGIRVKAFGGGVQTTVVEPGKYVWNGPGYSMYEYPVFKQTASWTAKEGTAFNFQTVEGLSVGADVGITYSVGHSCVAKFFSEFRVPIEQVTNTFVHNTVRQALNDNASNMKMEAVYGAGKVALFKRVTQQVQASLGPKCLNVDDVFLLSNLTLPDQVRNAITAKLSATQMAEQRQNELAQSQAEAAKEIAVAEGQAQAKVLTATAEAKSIQIKGDAIKNNPGLIELERVNAAKIAASRWNGAGNIVPNTVIGDSAGRNMIFQLPSQQ